MEKLVRPLTRDDTLHAMMILTRFIVPYKHEETVFGEWMEGLGATYYDGIGWRIVVGESRTMFACHLDSADKDLEEVTHLVTQNNRYLFTDGSTILSADDRSGVFILLHLLDHEIPGTYWFFVGEEKGRIGSQKLADSEDLSVYDKTQFDRVICFDRYGHSDIITEQSCGRTASDAFAEALSNAFSEVGITSYNFGARGTYTDSASFAYHIPECTNISVGYFDQHTNSESQDIHFLTAVANAAVCIDWEALPTKHEPLDKPERYKTTYYGGSQVTERLPSGLVYNYETKEWDRVDSKGNVMPRGYGASRYEAAPEMEYESASPTTQQNTSIIETDDVLIGANAASSMRPLYWVSFLELQTLVVAECNARGTAFRDKYLQDALKTARFIVGSMETGEPIEGILVNKYVLMALVSVADDVGRDFGLT